MPKKQNLILRSVSLLLTGVFFVSDIAWSAPISGVSSLSVVKPVIQLLEDPARFEAPLDFSILKEIHKGAPGKPLIIHIQDAHSNLSGQQNLAGALDEIMTKYKMNLVLVEGSSKEATLDPLKEVIPPSDLQRISKSLLMEGEIAGEEYLNLISSHPMRIMGIEDRSLYLKSIENYGLLADKRENILQYLTVIHQAVEKIKKKLYSKELLEYEKTTGVVSKKEGNFEEQFKVLISLASPDLIQNYSSLQQLIELQQQEKTIDFNQANLEQASVLEEISKKTGKENLEQNLKKLNRLKTSKLSQFSFFQNAFNIARNNNIDLQRYPNLLRYEEYLQKFSELDLEKVLDEQIRLEDQIYAMRLSDSKDALLIRSIDRYLKLLDTAHNIQMTTKDFKMLEVNESDFSTISYLAFLNKKLTEQGLFEYLIPHKNLLEKGKKALIDFYDSVNQRDLAFIQNTERILKEQDQKVAVLISGGYHTQHLTELFKKQGYSYVVLMPQVTQQTNQQKYEKQLLGFIRKETKTLTHTQGESKNNPQSLSRVDKDLALITKKEGVKAAGVVERAAVGSRFASILSDKADVSLERINQTMDQLNRRPLNPAFQISYEAGNVGARMSGPINLQLNDPEPASVKEKLLLLWIETQKKLSGSSNGRLHSEPIDNRLSNIEYIGDGMWQVDNLEGYGGSVIIKFMHREAPASLLDREFELIRVLKDIYPDLEPYIPDMLEAGQLDDRVGLDINYLHYLIYRKPNGRILNSFDLDVLHAAHKEKNTKKSEDITFNILDHVLEAVHKFHEHGIFLGSIQKNNIFLDEKTGQVTFMDFRLAVVENPIPKFKKFGVEDFKRINLDVKIGKIADVNLLLSLIYSFQINLQFYDSILASYLSDLGVDPAKAINDAEIFKPIDISEGDLTVSMLLSWLLYVKNNALEHVIKKINSLEPGDYDIEKLKQLGVPSFFRFLSVGELDTFKKDPRLEMVIQNISPYNIRIFKKEGTTSSDDGKSNGARLPISPEMLGKRLTSVLDSMNILLTPNVRYDGASVKIGVDLVSWGDLSQKNPLIYPSRIKYDLSLLQLPPDLIEPTQFLNQQVGAILQSIILDEEDIGYEIERVVEDRIRLQFNSMKSYSEVDILSDIQGKFSKEYDLYVANRQSRQNAGEGIEPFRFPHPLELIYKDEKDKKIKRVYGIPRSPSIDKGFLSVIFGSDSIMVPVKQIMGIRVFGGLPSARVVYELERSVNQKLSIRYFVNGREIVLDGIPVQISPSSGQVVVHWNDGSYFSIHFANQKVLGITPAVGSRASAPSILNKTINFEILMEELNARAAKPNMDLKGFVELYEIILSMLHMTPELKEDLETYKTFVEFVTKKMKEAREKLRIYKALERSLSDEVSDHEKLSALTKMLLLDPFKKNYLERKLIGVQDQISAQNNANQKVAQLHGNSSSFILTKIANTINSSLRDKSEYEAIALFGLIIGEDQLNQLTLKEATLALALLSLTVKRYAPAMQIYRRLTYAYRLRVVEKLTGEMRLDEKLSGYIQQLYLFGFEDEPSIRVDALKAALILSGISINPNTVDDRFISIRSEMTDLASELRLQLRLLGEKIVPESTIKKALAVESEYIRQAKNLDDYLIAKNSKEQLVLANHYFYEKYGIDILIPYEGEEIQAGFDKKILLEEYFKNKTKGGNKFELYLPTETSEVLSGLRKLDHWLSRLPREPLLFNTTLSELIILKKSTFATTHVPVGESAYLDNKSFIIVAPNEADGERTFYHEIGHTQHGIVGNFAAYFDIERIKQIVVKHKDFFNTTNPEILEDLDQLQIDNMGFFIGKVFRAIYQRKLSDWRNFNEKIGSKKLRTNKGIKNQYGGVADHLLLEYIFVKTLDQFDGEFERDGPEELIAEYVAERMRKSGMSILFDFDPAADDLLSALLGSTSRLDIAPMGSRLSEDSAASLNIIPEPNQVRLSSIEDLIPNDFQVLGVLVASKSLEYKEVAEKDYALEFQNGAVVISKKSRNVIIFQDETGNEIGRVTLTEAQLEEGEKNYRALKGQAIEKVISTARTIEDFAVSAAFHDYKYQDQITRKLLSDLVKGLSEDKLVVLYVSIKDQDVDFLVQQKERFKSEVTSLNAVSEHKLDVRVQFINEAGDKVEGLVSDDISDLKQGARFASMVLGVLSEPSVNYAKSRNGGYIAMEGARASVTTWGAMPYLPTFRLGVIAKLQDASSSAYQRALKMLMQLPSITQKQAGLVQATPLDATPETYRKEGLIVRLLATFKEQLYQAYVTFVSTGGSA